MKTIPLHSLVLIIGPATDEKNRIVYGKFASFEVLNGQTIQHELFGSKNRTDVYDVVVTELYRRAAVKLSLGARVVIDMPNLLYKERMAATRVGAKFGVPIFYVVVDSKRYKGESNANHVQKQYDQFKQYERDILRGDNQANVINTRIDEFKVINRLPDTKLLQYLKAQGYKGLCVVPDVHGMVDSLKQAIDWAKARNLFLVFLGDLIDYGPKSIECVYLVYDLIVRSRAIMTIGNHERKIERWLDQQRKLLHDADALKGKTPIRLSEGNRATTAMIEAMTQPERNIFESRFRTILAFARHHWMIGNDTLFVHGAAEPDMFTFDSVRLTGRLEYIALYGEVDKEKPLSINGRPNRTYGWIDRIPNGKRVIVGHDIRNAVKPLRLRGALGGEAYFMDTGSGKGGRLTTADLMFTENDIRVQNFTAH